MVTISSAFDAGNIEEVGRSESGAVQLRIKPDPYTELEKKAHMQWFAFRATFPCKAEATSQTFEIVNAGDVSYPAAYDTCGATTVCVSTDRQRWTRSVSTGPTGRGRDESASRSWRGAHFARRVLGRPVGAPRRRRAPTGPPEPASPTLRCGKKEARRPVGRRAVSSELRVYSSVSAYGSVA